MYIKLCGQFVGVFSYIIQPARKVVKASRRAASSVNLQLSCRFRILSLQVGIKKKPRVCGRARLLYEFYETCKMQSYRHKCSDSINSRNSRQVYVHFIIYHSSVIVVLFYLYQTVQFLAVWLLVRLSSLIAILSFYFKYCFFSSLQTF